MCNFWTCLGWLVQHPPPWDGTLDDTYEPQWSSSQQVFIILFGCVLWYELFLPKWCQNFNLLFHGHGIKIQLQPIIFSLSWVRNETLSPKVELHWSLNWSLHVANIQNLLEICKGDNYTTPLWYTMEEAIAIWNPLLKTYWWRIPPNRSQFIYLLIDYTNLHTVLEKNPNLWNNLEAKFGTF
jgi:hypothetical protein